VQAAKPKESPAHDGFEWNNSKAANEYRLVQARQWLRVVKVEVSGEPQRMVHVPVRQQDTGRIADGYYKPISVVVENQDEYAAALEQARSKLASAAEAVDELSEVATQEAKLRNVRIAAHGIQTAREALQ
jgi:DNA repair ATPase RecN